MLCPAAAWASSLHSVGEQGMADPFPRHEPAPVRSPQSLQGWASQLELAREWIEVQHRAPSQQA